MIIDFHWHFTMKKLDESDALQRAEIHRAIWERSARIKPEKSLREMAKERVYITDDPDGAKLLQRMEKAGIDVTVACPIDVMEDSRDEEAILAENKACANLERRNPGKIIAFASIDPRRKNAPQLLKRCVEEYSMKGLKWHPDYSNFYPNSPEAYEMLEVAQELRIPLLTHTGCMWGQSRGKFTHPLLLDEVALDFPELTIVAAHTGHLLWRDWCAASYFKRNLYGDLAEWNILAVGQYEFFCRFLREVIDISGADRILFGSDGPWFELLVSNERWVQIIKELPRNAPEGIKFTDEEVAAILGGNAQKILGIGSSPPAPPSIARWGHP